VFLKYKDIDEYDYENESDISVVFEIGLICDMTEKNKNKSLI